MTQSTYDYIKKKAKQYLDEQRTRRELSTILGVSTAVISRVVNSESLEAYRQQNRSYRMAREIKLTRTEPVKGSIWQKLLRRA